MIVGSDQPPPSEAEKPPEKQLRPPAFRIARAVVGALLLVALFYLVAMNVFMSTPLFTKVIDGKPATIDIHYRRGWSLSPGHIHAKNLSIRGRDGNVEWILRLDTVEFDVSLFALARQRFEASHVYGRGVSFRLRQRLGAPPSTEADVANLPPIEGLGPYAVRPPPHPEPEVWSDAAYHLWSADLEDVVADDVREIWIDDVRFEGRAKVAGRFALKPIRKVDIGPIEIDVQEGHARTGTSVVVERLEDTKASVTVAPFDPRTVQGTDILRRVSLAVAMHPAFPDVGRLPLSMPEGARITGEADVRQLVIDLRGGALQPGTLIDATLPHAAVKRRGHSFALAIAVAGGVTRAGTAERLDFRAQLTDLEVARTGDSPAAARVFLHVPYAIVTGDSHELDLANAFADLHLLVDVAEGDLPDVRALSAYIPRKTPLALKGGAGRVAAHLETWLADKRATGNASLHIDDLRLRLGEMRLRGAASADASFGSFQWETSLLQNPRLSLRISGGTLASERTPAIVLVRVDDLRADARAGALALEDPMRAFGASIVLDGGEIVDPALLRAYLPKDSEMHILPRHARFSLVSELELVNHLARGTLDVSSKRLGLSFRDYHFALDLRARARVHDWHWERGDLALDRADVDVTDISVYRPGKDPGDDVLLSGVHPPSTPTGQALSLRRIVLGAKSRHFAFEDPLSDVALSASLVEARVHDSTIINAFLPTGVPFLIRANDGVFSSDLGVEIQKHVLQGEIAVRAVHVGIGGKSLEIGGDVDVLAHVSGWDFATSTLAVKLAHVLFSRVAGSFHGSDADSSLGATAFRSIDVPSVPGREASFAKPDFRAERVELWASTPMLDLVRPSRHNLDGRVAIVGAELPDARVLQKFMPANAIMGVESGRARASGDLEFSSTRHTAQGRLDVDLTHTGIRFHETHLAGDFQLSARIVGYDPGRDRFNVSGSRFAMRNVEVTNASTPTLQWRGEAAFDQATFRIDPEPELDGRLTLEARDASPILAILLGNALPRIFAGLTRMPHLSAISRLTMGARRVALRDLDAHGGDLSIQGTYVLGRNHRAGAFVVGKGPFSAGFRLNDDGARLRLFGLQSWLREQTAASLRLLDEPSTTSASGECAKDSSCVR